jgi:hypothetical protein
MQDVTFGTNAQLDGWTHTASTANFTAGTTGTYLISYNVTANVTGGAAQEIGLRLVKNGTLVAGTETLRDLSSNGIEVPIGAGPFIVDVTAGDIIKLQFAGQSTSVLLTTTDELTSMTTRSASISITRIK